ncbi:MAG: alpha/beta hydrolase [Saprospiraceae bacterium]|nr:alpha/beta hydrolase [Saprospiraceae bacterium]
MDLTADSQQIRYHRPGADKTFVILIPGGPSLIIDDPGIIPQMLPPALFTAISFQPSGTYGNFNSPFLKSIKRYANELKMFVDRLQIDSLLFAGTLVGSSAASGVLISISILQSFRRYPDEQSYLGQTSWRN